MSDNTPRSDTPVTDALRKSLQDPKFAQEFATSGNALAAGLRAVDEVRASHSPTEETKDPAHGTIDSATFERVDLRIGTIKEAERVKKSDKLVRLQVDLGEDKLRQIVAGIGKSFTPEALVGQQVMVVANLAPIKLMGVESHGMIVAAGDKEDLALLSPSKPRSAGTRVK